MKNTEKLIAKEGEKIESINGIDLVKTYLTVDISSDQIHGSADIEFLDTNQKGKYKLQVAIIENLQIKQDTFIEDSKQQVKTSFCVKDGQEIIPGALVAQTSYFKIERKSRKYNR
jgi:DNA-directed RNA polymerase subunit beta'